jgi:hypothetical protein
MERQVEYKVSERHTLEDRTLNWRDMPEFSAVDLEDSWLLGWRYEPAYSRLTVDIEASLWPGHPAYAAPALGEYTCYRRGALTFDGVDAVSGLRDQATVQGHRDPDGSVDYGSVDVLDGAGGVFRLVGKMGDVTVRAAALRLEISSTRNFRPNQQGRR